jgi:hypothetical protein
VDFKVDGLGDQDKGRAIAEIVGLAEAAGLSNVIDQVIVAADFSRAVKDHLGPSEGRTYDPIHDYGRAVAKTLPKVENGQLRFALIFDARMFSDTTVGGVIYRQYLVIHELSHIANGLRRFKNASELRQAEPRDETGHLAENAWSLWEEYCAERSAAEVVVGGLRAGDPRSEIEFLFASEHSDAVLTGLDSIASFLEGELARFRRREIDLTELTHSVTSKVASVAIQLAYVYALAGVSQKVADKIVLIESHASFKRFFESGWQEMLAAFREWFDDRQTYRRDLLDRSAHGYDVIIRSAGLEISDAGPGYHVRVRGLPP